MVFPQTVLGSGEQSHYPLSSDAGAAVLKYPLLLHSPKAVRGRQSRLRPPSPRGSLSVSGSVGTCGPERGPDAPLELCSKGKEPLGQSLLG